MTRKIWIGAFQIICILLLLLLSISTFIPQVSEFPADAYPGPANRLIDFLQLDRFYGSPLNIALWGLLSAIILGAVLWKGIRTPHQKILHLLLATCFIVIAIEKTINRRFYITVTENEMVRFSDYIGSREDRSNIRLKLLRFEIQRHPDQRTPKAFISHLLINERDTVKLAVNRPRAIEHYRLYQSAYDQQFYFPVMFDQQVYTMSIGDSIKIEDTLIRLAGFDHSTKMFRTDINDQVHHFKLNQIHDIANHKISIGPGRRRYSSIIEVVEVRGTKLLLALGLLYLVSLYISLWHRRRTKFREERS